jgi:hypothetical protein
LEDPIFLHFEIIDFFLLLSFSSGRLDLLLCDPDSFLLRQATLVFFFERAFSLLAHDEELLVEVSILAMLANPFKGGLNRLPFRHGHEQSFFRGVLAKAHLHNLLHEVSLHVRSNGLPLGFWVLSRLGQHLCLLKLGCCVLLLKLLGKGHGIFESLLLFLNIGLEK